MSPGYRRQPETSLPEFWATWHPRRVQSNLLVPLWEGAEGTIQSFPYHSVTRLFSKSALNICLEHSTVTQTRNEQAKRTPSFPQGAQRPVEKNHTHGVTVDLWAGMIRTGRDSDTGREPAHPSHARAQRGSEPEGLGAPRIPHPATVGQPGFASVGEKAAFFFQSRNLPSLWKGPHPSLTHAPGGLTCKREGHGAAWRLWGLLA